MTENEGAYAYQTNEGISPAEVAVAEDELGLAQVPQEASGSDLMNRGRSWLYERSHTFHLSLSFGGNNVPGMFGRTTLTQREDGLVFFPPHKDVLYEVLEVSWEGPYYQAQTVTENQSRTKGRSGRKGRLLGAAVGTVLLPGVGTVIGAAAGTGKKWKEDTAGRSVSYEQHVEQPAPCKITLLRLNTQETITIGTNVLSDVASELLALIADDPGELSELMDGRAVVNLPGPVPSDEEDGVEYEEDVYEEEYDDEDDDGSELDPYEEMKKLKELLDLEIISQDEFDAKKAELLGL